MNENELRERLKDIHRRLERIEEAASCQGNWFYTVALIVLLFRGC